jgi:hypothetical protein
MENKILDLLASAEEHAASLREDILLCKTREEHVRITARANEAAAIVTLLNYFRETASHGDI